ncbi:MAG: hypothetical protein R2939_15770 [Kofleriaceae bacterium]
MATTRRYRQSGWIALALVLSASAQGAAMVAYELTRDDPQPVLAIHKIGDGDGLVRVERVDTGAVILQCAASTCRLPTDRGTALRLVAVAAADAIFGGWSQLPMRTPAPLRGVLGDPLAACTPEALSAPGQDVRVCALVLDASVDVEVAFDGPPEQVDVAWVTAPALDDVVLPAITEPIEEPPTPAPTPPRAPTPPKPTPAAIDAEQLTVDRPVEVALVPPPPELAVPPPPPPPEQPPPPPVAPIPANMRMVEVPDEHVVDKAPDDATHLSDKNRDVAEETAATDTNLERAMDGTAVASIEHPDTTSPEVGGPDDVIRQLETSTATTPERLEISDRSGDAGEASGAIVGDGGDDGQEGTGETSEPGMLAMRDIGGRGSLVERARGDGRKPGERGAPGVGARLDMADYERLVGKDKVDAERELAARKASARKGRWEKKFEAIKSALENFTPDVRPGNQTALKTRAHPFALYVARMHRRIHELWGFGFLDTLDGKPADYALNDFELWVNLENALNPDGTVYKTTIAHPSGKLEFDVAAIDTIMTAGPYEETPEEIRSVDQRVYLRWAFYRNWRQCGTFNVEPYILTDIPGGIEPIAGGGATRGTTTVTPDAGGQGPRSPTTTVKSEAALMVANLWISGLATAEVGKMVAQSRVPFATSSGATADNQAELADLYKELIVDAGQMVSWELLTAAEYAAGSKGAAKAPDGTLLLSVRGSKLSFVIVLVPDGGGYRAAQLVR